MDTGKTKTVKEIITNYLIKNGYGGLCHFDCGCNLDDLIPCDSDFSHCEPGYKVPCKCNDNCGFHIDNKQHPEWRGINNVESINIGGTCLKGFSHVFVNKDLRKTQYLLYFASLPSLAVNSFASEGMLEIQYIDREPKSFGERMFFAIIEYNVVNKYILIGQV